jgi:ketosteroid isomerase-like protein
MSEQENIHIVRELFDSLNAHDLDIGDKHFADGDKVAVTWVSTGTHTGSLVSASGMTVPATNRKIRNTGTSVFEFRNGKVIRQDLYFDQVELLNQLGVMETIQRR